MSEKPILFSSPMVRAILEGRKTQTRRVVKVQWCQSAEALMRQSAFDPAYRCPYGVPGDRLWVRETWGLMAPCDTTDWCRGSIAEVPESELRELYLVEHAANWNLPSESAYWRPSIHMPRWACRLVLEITAVRVERLQDITEEDAEDEGVTPENGLRWNQVGYTPREAFLRLWESIYGNRPSLPKNPNSKRYQRVKRWLEKHPANGWDANPYVWVVEFRKVEDKR